MAAGSSFLNLFGAGPIVPAQPSYEALTIAANTPLVWPQETTGGSPYVAQQIDVTAANAGLSILMPPGNTGSNGAQSIVTNIGANNFTVTDQAGNQITVLSPTQSWLITLTSNTTPNGSWRAYQLASTTSSATAAALAGPGLQAIGTELQTIWETAVTDSVTLITASYRSTVFVWNGDEASILLDTVANLTPGWFCAISNQGTGSLTVGTSDSTMINGGAGIIMAPGNSGVFVCNPDGFYTFGALVTTLSIAEGGTGAVTAAAALVNLGGTAIGTSIFTAPSAAAVVALLGLNNFTFKEATVTTNQTLAAGSTNTAFVCTAALTLTLPLTTTLTTTFVLMAYAQGGDVVLAPQASDAIDGGTAGDSLTIPEGGSAFICTDANNNWWTVFGPTASFSTLLVGTAATLNGTINGTALPAVVQGYLSGLTLSNDGGAPNTILDIAAGTCTDAANAITISLGAFTKSTAGAWVAGTGSHGMGQGLTIANSTWYHVFAIIVTGAADVYFDTSASAANKPAGTTAFRRIGSFRTDGSAHILAFYQFYDTFIWAAQPQDYNTSVAVYPSTTNIPLSVPTSINVIANLSVALIDSAEASAVAIFPTFAEGVSNLSCEVATTSGNGQINVMTDTSRQVGAYCTSATNTLTITTTGWLDTRGK